MDDLEQGVTDVVRGRDLVECTLRQRYLASQISPSHVLLRYHHAPLFMDPEGNRMSKRNGSFAVNEWRNNGGSSNSMIAMLAHSIGLIDTLEPMSSTELLNEVALGDIDQVFNVR